MTVANGWEKNISWQTGVPATHAMTPWAPVVIRLAVSMLPGDAALILGSKAPRLQLNIDILKGLRTKVLYFGELAESEHGLAAVPGTGRPWPSVCGE